MKFRVHAKLLVVMFAAVLTACSSIASDVIIVETQPYENDLIKGYRQWTRVNPVPALFHSRFAAMCAPAAPTAKEVEMEKGNPHTDKFITVYVNELGTKSMMQEKDPRFPQGSVIVKEKLPSKESTSPELLTVMIKREAGYNAENGDWEYIALDGTGKEVQARGRLENCQGCHTLVKHYDFVYRNYLPSEVWNKLK